MGSFVAVAASLALALITLSQDIAVPPLAGGTVRDAQTISGPLELKPATADSEAVLAGTGYLQKTYTRQPVSSNAAFVSMYRDWFISAGWRIIDVSRPADPDIESEAVTVSATYASSGRLLFATVRADADTHSVNVADVGAEDWGATLDATCHIPVYGIGFDFNKATIRPDATPVLEKLAATLVAKAGARVEVQGHTDNQGDDSSPPSLSEARARSVVAWLIAHGVPPGMLSAKGYGKTRPVMENDSDLGRARNRRIEIARTDCQ